MCYTCAATITRRGLRCRAGRMAQGLALGTGRADATSSVGTSQNIDQPASVRLPAPLGSASRRRCPVQQVRHHYHWRQPRKTIHTPFCSLAPRQGHYCALHRGRAVHQNPLALLLFGTKSQLDCNPVPPPARERTSSQEGIVLKSVPALPLCGTKLLLGGNLVPRQAHFHTLTQGCIVLRLHLALLPCGTKMQLDCNPVLSQNLGRTSPQDKTVP